MKQNLIGEEFAYAILKFHCSWDWQIPVWSKVVQQLKLAMHRDRKHLDFYFKQLEALIRSTNKKEFKKIAMARILVACEESQAVTIELRKLRHEAFSCDLLPCSGEHPEWHFQGGYV